MGLLVYCCNLKEAEQILEAIFIVAFSEFDDKIVGSNEYTPCHSSENF